MDNTSRATSQYTIRAILTPHQSRLVNYYGHTNQLNSRRESALIAIKPTKKDVSKITQVQLPRAFLSNVQSITKAKHAELYNNPSTMTLR